MPYLGLALIFVFVVEELITTQYEPSLLPVLHDAPLLLQPAGLEYRAQLVGGQGPPRAPVLFPHHQALGASWKPRTHSECGETLVSLAAPICSPGYPGTKACGPEWQDSWIHFPLGFLGHVPEQFRSSMGLYTCREVYNVPL